MARRRFDWDIRWHGDEIAQRVQEASEDGLKAAGEQAINDADVPIRSGALKRSGRVDVVFPVAIVSFGMSGRDARGRSTRHYAIPQHQRFDYTHPGGGGPQFLSKQLHPGMRLLDVIAERIRRVLRGT